MVLPLFSFFLPNERQLVVTRLPAVIGQMKKPVRFRIRAGLFSDLLGDPIELGKVAVHISNTLEGIRIKGHILKLGCHCLCPFPKIAFSRKSL